MNFNIQSTNNIYEHISNQFLVYLYNFVNSNYNENNISMLKGNIEVLHGYLHMINYLHEKFLDLHISISLSLYLSFEDNLAKQYCADTFGDGIGVIESDVNNISSSDIVNNSYSLPNGVVKFNELKYFENLTTINGTNFDHQTYVLFRNCKNTLQELDLRNITDIPSDYALVGLSALKIINNTSQLRNLGSCTFCKCTSLENVSITNLTNTIGYGIFGDCTALKTANIDSTVQTKIPNDIFSNCTSLTTVSGFSHCTSIGVRSFQNCSSLTTLNITNLDLITFIDQLAFENCISLTTVNFPNVTTIGISAFKGCTSLTTFTGSNLTYIREKAFLGCTSLSSINFSAVTKFELSCFDGCSNLGKNQDLDFNLDGKTMSSNVFKGTGYKSITLHETTYHAISGFTGSGIYDTFGALMPNLQKYDLSDTKQTGSVGSIYANAMTTLIYPETQTSLALIGKNYGTSLLYIICLSRQLNDISTSTYWEWAYMLDDCAIYVWDDILDTYLQMEGWQIHYNLGRVKRISELPSNITWYTKE